MILTAYGIPDYSTIQVSECLRDLRLSHTIEGGLKHTVYTIDGLCKEQPVWPIVVDSVKAISRLRTKMSHTVLFVCDSRAALATSNLSAALWPEQRSPNFSADLKLALTTARNRTEGWSLVNNEPTTLDYVNSATTPSFVNKCQDAIYKITPYALRKEVQQLLIAYLAGTASYTALNKRLKTSLKLQTLSDLMHTPKAKELRDAVALLSKSSVEEVAKKTGFQTFELLYISRSNAKTTSEAKAKR
jgi:hypothetical protein